jgi:hypothetical protein
MATKCCAACTQHPVAGISRFFWTALSTIEEEQLGSTWALTTSINASARPPVLLARVQSHLSAAGTRSACCRCRKVVALPGAAGLTVIV